MLPDPQSDQRILLSLVVNERNRWVLWANSAQCVNPHCTITEPQLLVSLPNPPELSNNRTNVLESNSFTQSKGSKGLLPFLCHTTTYPSLPKNQTLRVYLDAHPKGKSRGHECNPPAIHILLSTPRAQRMGWWGSSRHPVVLLFLRTISHVFL